MTGLFSWDPKVPGGATELWELRGATELWELQFGYYYILIYDNFVSQ